MSADGSVPAVRSSDPADADHVGRLESELRTVVPAGADVGAFGITTALWPAMLLAPDLCET